LVYTREGGQFGGTDDDVPINGKLAGPSEDVQLFDLDVRFRL
jgi:hypothetical protein